MRKKKRKSVLLALGWYVHEINLGVARYAREAGWILEDMASHSGNVPPSWKGDGIITLISDRNQVGLIGSVAQAGLPVVNLSDQVPELPYPRVLPDNDAIGRVAAQEFLSRGFEHLAFLVLSRDAPVVQERMGGFRALAEQEGKRFYAIDFTPHWQDAQAYNNLLPWLGRQLKKLPKPLAVMAQYDAEANYVVRACLDAGIEVPDQVAVIGVDNDLIYSELGPVPLTSVVSNREALGYEGAALLDRLMRGGRAPDQPKRIAPSGIVLRRSSDVFTVEDEHLRRALNFIARHVTVPFSVEDVVAVSGASRRSLYNKFNGYLGHSIQREIMRQRLNMAKQMLCNTREKVQSVAEACGFEDGMKLTKAFRSHENITPSQLRVQQRLT